MSAGIPWSEEMLYGKTTGVDMSNREIIDLDATTHDLDWDQGVQCLHLNPSVPINITGFVAPVTNEHTYLMVLNVSANDISFIHEGTNSQAINRFRLSESTNETISSNEMFLFIYIPEYSRWFVQSKV